MRPYTILCILFLLALSGSLFPCTILYSAQGEYILGGNNEDYNDFYTYMWIYPAEDDKLGWVKFSYGSGFPQGGINEEGLFWDAASAPYLDMPYSIENKELYDGPLMQKVIEECGSIQEAQAVFEQYYCSDQFRAQYLIGDSSGISMIVEGDDTLINNGNYQVLTNFNLNHPELGGYPCWRYDTAMEMFESGEHDLYLMGFILSATHQEGSYPTLYSNIYDLLNRQIYLFDNHNFNEYILIDLMEELEKGYNVYHISAQFSSISSRYPEYEAVINTTTLNIQWEGRQDSSYELQYSLDPEFEDYESILVDRRFNNLSEQIMYFPVLGGLLLIGSYGLLKRKSLISFLLIFLIAFLLFSCSSKDDTVNEDHLGSYLITLENLEPGNIYYWRLFAQRDGSVFTSQTTIFAFSISER